MANVKNFGLVGVGTSVQFGKAGPSLGQQSTTILKADGTAAFRLPSGTTGQQPAAATAGSGGMRYNETTSSMEFSNGTTWTPLATGGAAVTSVSGTTDRITSTGGLTPVIDIASTYVGQTSITTLGTVTAGTWNGSTVTVPYGGTGATTLTANGVLLGNGTSAVSATAVGTTGQVLVGNTAAAPTWATLTDTAVTSFQTSLAGLTPSSATTGAVTLAGTLGGASGGTGVNNGANTITIAGNVNLAGSFTTTGANALSIATTGATSVTMPTSGTLLTTADTSNYVSSIAGTAGNITVSASTGAVTVNLDTVGTPVSASFVKITTDTFGRVTATTPVVTADITALVDATYVNVAGDTMTGNLNMGANYVTMTNAPVADTDGANKAYVDSIANGLSWKQAVLAATTANITLSGAQTIDGVSVVAGNRVLVKNQSTAADNGIYVAAAGAWTRATDADTPSELDGAAVFVQQGTVNLDSGWTQTATIVTVGTTAQTWVQFSGGTLYTWGTGLVESGNTVSVNLGAGIAELPSDEVGIDLYDSANNPLILTLDGTTRDNSGPGPTAAAKLGLLLDGSSLSMGAGGLRVAAGGVDLTTMVTGVLPPANGGTGVNNGSNTLTLGGNLTTSGAFVSTFTMTGATNVTFPTSGTLLSTANIAANAVTSITFGTTGLTPNTATNGAVSVAGTLVVANGGTGATSFTAGRVLLGDGTNPIAEDADLAFNAGTNTLTVGSGTFQGTASGDVTITATATNADINLNPNGTGAVVVGPGGSPGLISSDTNQNLTVQASGTGLLTLTSGGDTTMVLPSGTGSKVTVSGPTAADYATSLADADLVNKYYVDQVASAGGAGDVKAVMATVNLGVNASTNIGAALPAGATILSVKVNVTVVNTTSVLVVGKSGGSEYMTGTENDPQTTGLYLAETMVTEAGSEQVQATVTGQSGGVGSCVVIVTYKLA